MRISKFCCSTWCWAEAIALETMPDSIGWSSGMFSRVHDHLDPGRVEQAHQVVFERQVEARLAGVTLTAGAATELVVDAAGLVALGAEDVEATEGDDLFVFGLDRFLRLLQRLGVGLLVFLGGLDRVEAAVAEFEVGAELGVAAEHDVGASTGHVGGDGDGALAARLGDDRGLTRVVLRVQHLVADALVLEHPRQPLGLLDAGRADEDGLTGLVALLDVVDARHELGVFGLVDHVGLVFADHRPVRRDRHDAQLVGLVELVGLGGRRAGHAGQGGVEAEVVLEGDRGESLVLVLDLHTFLGLDGLVRALVVAPAVEHAAGELVDDQDLAVDDDVVLVLLEQFLGLEGVVEELDEMGVFRLVEVVDAQQVFDLLDAGLEDADRSLLLVDHVVAGALGAVLAFNALAEAGDDLGELGVPLAGLLAPDRR